LETTTSFGASTILGSLAERNTPNDFGGFAEVTEERWLALYARTGTMRRFDLNYGAPA
jgi:hypothetical protein